MIEHKTLTSSHLPALFPNLSTLQVDWSCTYKLRPGEIPVGPDGSEPLEPHSRRDIIQVLVHTWPAGTLCSGVDDAKGRVGRAGTHSTQGGGITHSGASRGAARLETRARYGHPDAQGQETKALWQERKLQHCPVATRAWQRAPSDTAAI